MRINQRVIRSTTAATPTSISHQSFMKENLTVDTRMLSKNLEFKVLGGAQVMHALMAENGSFKQNSIHEI